MEQQIYERPRERIRSRGAQSLSITELLQVIIGSGSKNHAVAKLAKNVSDVLASNDDINPYGALRAIPGIGDAAACRVIAALYLSNIQNNHDGRPLQRLDIQKLMVHKQQKVYCFTFDGEHTVINNHSWSIKERKTTSLIAKQLFAKALSDGAYSIVVIIGFQKQLLSPGVFELGLLNDLRELAGILQIKLEALAIANKTETIYLHGRP